MPNLGNPEHCLWWGVVIDASDKVVVGGETGKSTIKQPHRQTAERIAWELYQYVKNIPGYKVDTTEKLSLKEKQ
jgi:hypothetical protein